MSGTGHARRQVRNVECTVEIEESSARLEAHVDLADFEVGPGDSVHVHDAPRERVFGERQVVRRLATVTRAGRLERAWTRLAGLFELGELFEVGFSSRRKA